MNKMTLIKSYLYNFLNINMNENNQPEFVDISHIICVINFYTISKEKSPLTNVIDYILKERNEILTYLNQL